MGMALIALLGLLTFAAPAWAGVGGGCCCHCDFGGGDIECGTTDNNCTFCEQLGGTCTTEPCDGKCTSPACACGKVPFTPSATPTATPTSTPTNTPLPNGGGCSVPSQCASGFCVDSVCCDTECTGSGQRCAVPGQVGTCVTAAPAPTLSIRGLLIAALLLIGTGVLALVRLRR